MEMPALPTALVLLALAGTSFFFALAEGALFALGRWQLKRLSESGPAGARVARLMEQPEEVLSMLTMANTFINGMLVVTSLRLALSRDWSLPLPLAGTFLVMLVVGEVLPKTLAVRAPERWAVQVAPAVAVLQWVTRPPRRMARRLMDFVLSWFAPGGSRPAPINDEEYRELLEMAVQQGALGRSEKEIIAELITLDRKCARDVMRPRATMACISDALSPEELVQSARRLKHRRLPMYDETPDTIVGVLNAQQLLIDPRHALDEAVEFPSFVPESMNLWQLFQSLQRQKRSLAIVLDEFGTVSGVVRMEDILAVVLGDVSGEGPRRGFVFERLGRGRWRASGVMRLDDFRREHPALPRVTEVETLGGLLLSQLDIVPKRGESATVHGLRLTAEVVDERRVREVIVEVVGR